MSDMRINFTFGKQPVNNTNFIKRNAIGENFMTEGLKNYSKSSPDCNYVISLSRPFEMLSEKFADVEFMTYPGAGKIPPMTGKEINENDPNYIYDLSHPFV